jgi:hypothetical protein
MKRAPFAGLCAVTCFARLACLPCSDALADDRSACFDAAAQGQTFRDQHKLVEARDRFRVCAQQTCPKSMKTDCAGWLDATEKELPTVVLSAKDGSGRDVLDATVTLDGHPLASKLDGQAVAVNPGPHAFRFERLDGTTATEQVLLKEGEKVRSIAVVLTRVASAAPAAVAPASPASLAAPAAAAPAGADETPAASSPGGGMRTAGWITGGAGLAGLAAGIALVAVGGGDRGDCRSDGGCPNQAALDKYNRGTPLLNAGYVLLAAGGVATAAGVVLWIASPGRANPEAGRRDGVRVGVSPAGGLVVEGGF